MKKKPFPGKIMNKFIVEEENENLRLDAFLTLKISDKSRSYIQKAINIGNVLVNQRQVKSSYRLKRFDEITYEPLKEKVLEIVESDIPLNILYEDEDLFVINKPRGMVVHPANGHFSGGTLVNALLHRKESLSSINGMIRPGIVHRIDKDTSGLIVVAKNDAAHIFLASQLKDKTMHREYYALAEGILENNEILVRAPIGKDPYNRLKMAVNLDSGKEAVTHFHVLERYKNATFLSCQLETGRTHQIRVHLEYIKHPIIGDFVYGRKYQPLTDKGQMLHAYQLTFIHPTTKKSMTFTCDPDAEFKRVQKILKEE